MPKKIIFVTIVLLTISCQLSDPFKDVPPDLVQPIKWYFKGIESRNIRDDVYHPEYNFLGGYLRYNFQFTDDSEPTSDFLYSSFKILECTKSTENFSNYTEIGSKEFYFVKILFEGKFQNGEKGPLVNYWVFAKDAKDGKYKFFDSYPMTKLTIKPEN